MTTPAANVVVSPKTFAGIPFAPVRDTRANINLLIYGQPGVGKTFLAATADHVPAMRPVLYLNIEGGDMTLRHAAPEIKKVPEEGSLSWAQLEAVYDQIARQCLTGDTEVITLNRNRLIAALQKGDWVWGWTDEDGWTPALVEEVFVQGVKPVYEVVLDDRVGNLSRFRATGDHLLMLRDGTYARVDKLIRGTSLMPATVSTVTVGKSKKQYHVVKPDNKWTTPLEYMHRVAARFFGMDIEGMVVHHRNDADPNNTFNNYPDNLECLSRGDHSKLTDFKWHTSESEQASAAGLQEYYNEKRGRPGQGSSRDQVATAIQEHPDWTRMQVAEHLNLSVSRVYRILQENKQNHRVVSITPAGEEPTFDIQTSTRNFAIGAGIFVHNCYNGVQPGEYAPRTVILDTLTECQKMNMSQLMAELLMAEPEKNWDPDIPDIRRWGKNIEQIRKWVRKYRDLPVNVIMTAHERQEKDALNGSILHMPQLSGKLSFEVAGFFDVVTYLYMKTEDGKPVRKLLTGAREGYIGKDRSGNLPDVMIDPTMADIYKGITQGISKKPETS